MLALSIYPSGVCSHKAHIPISSQIFPSTSLYSHSQVSQRIMSLSKNPWFATRYRVLSTDRITGRSAVWDRESAV